MDGFEQDETVVRDDWHRFNGVVVYDDPSLRAGEVFVKYLDGHSERFTRLSCSASAWSSVGINKDRCVLIAVSPGDYRDSKNF